METVGVNYKYAYLLANVFFFLVWGPMYEFIVGARSITLKRI